MKFDLFSNDFKTPQIASDIICAEPVWNFLNSLDEAVYKIKDDRRGSIHPTAVVTGNVYLAENAWIGPHAVVEGPAWIGEHCWVGQGAYLHHGVILTFESRVGHGSEVKRSLLLNRSYTTHLTYVGDSLIGANCTIGGGVMIANTKIIPGHIKINGFSTGLDKLGAIIGDNVKIGANCVLQPGTVIQRGAAVLPLSVIGGVVQPEVIIGNDNRQSFIKDISSKII